MSRYLITCCALALLNAFCSAQESSPKANASGREAKSEKNLAYGDHEREKLDLFLPPASAKPTPLVIWVHGGGWEAGSKEGNNPVNPLLKEGYAVACINYRYSKQAVFPAQIEDCKAAVRYLRGNATKFNLDKDHFGAIGASAGGHLVALLGTTGDVKELEGKVGKFPKESSRVQAVIDWFGPTDLEALTSPLLSNDNPISRLLGGSVKEKKDLARLANPISHITKDDAPFLILHGDQDPLVPVSQSELLYKALKRGGVPAELVVVPGVGHDARVLTPENSRKSKEFFDKYLKVSK
ncbi:alpha/beta hydrolase [Telmatocola sphagniphila]|uniref:Alpha/beta hydrolase n=1 Tax=Telmatocola sphagniphila TaxID=1123043 RepID=A0A8E6B675_9BACT|nr:alpha/beta hydrolase [Telmatocola sphagniphila]QVL32491.1 alpha/beta hydrolase [Telmatocola sphagniphila]